MDDIHRWWISLSLGKINLAELLKHEIPVIPPFVLPVSGV